MASLDLEKILPSSIIYYADPRQPPKSSQKTYLRIARIRRHATAEPDSYREIPVVRRVVPKVVAYSLYGPMCLPGVIKGHQASQIHLIEVDFVYEPRCDRPRHCVVQCLSTPVTEIDKDQLRRVA